MMESGRSRPIMEFRPPLGHRNRNRHQQIRAFCHAARLGSFTRAAEHLSISQPAVSRHVQALEEEFGVPLFHRGGKCTTLTHSGELFYRLALPLTVRMDRLLDTFREERGGVASGALRIAAGQTSAASVLPRHLKRFQERHPGIRIDVRIGNSRLRMRLLRSYDVEIAFGAVDVPEPDTEFRSVFTSEIMLITPVDHPLAGRESVSVEEMVRWPMVTHPAGTHARDLAEMIGRLHGVAHNVSLQVEGWIVIKRYVEAGLGIALVPDHCIAEGDLVHRIAASRYFPPRTYGISVRRDDTLPLAAEHFMQDFDSVDPGPPAGSSGAPAAGRAG